MNTTCRHTTIARARHRLGVLLLPTILIGCTTPAPEAATGDHPSVVVTQWGDATELFLEYPHLIAGTATGNWAIHLTSQRDFKPITVGTLTVRFTSNGSTAKEFVLEAPARNGIYLLDPVIADTGTYQVELMLDSPQAQSRHVLPAVTVWASVDRIPAGTEEAGGGISFLKEQQWVIDYATLPAAEREVHASLSAPAEVLPQDGRQVLVSAPVSGLAKADGNLSAPSLGDRVQANQVLAVLSPLAEADGYARIRERLERLEREVARDQRLFDAGAIAARRLEKARHELAVARAEADAIGLGAGDGYQHRVRAPIAGEITERRFVPGGRVEAGAPLFTIADVSRVWLRVRLREAEAARLPERGRAEFTPEGGTTSFATTSLVSVSSVVDSASRTVTALFAMDNAQRALRLGQFGRVVVPLAEQSRGIAIPAEAVLDDGGMPVAYVQVSGETFERRRLRTGVTDGAWTEVLEGIRVGEMVVVRGAYQVRLASLSNTPMSGGHAH